MWEAEQIWFPIHFTLSPYPNLVLDPLQIVPMVAIHLELQYGVWSAHSAWQRHLPFGESSLSSVLSNFHFNSLLSSFDIVTITLLICHVIWKKMQEATINKMGQTFCWSRLLWRLVASACKIRTAYWITWGRDFFVCRWYVIAEFDENSNYVGEWRGKAYVLSGGFCGLCDGVSLLVGQIRDHGQFNSSGQHIHTMFWFYDET
jgi:hypothetical protein